MNAPQAFAWPQAVNSWGAEEKAAAIAVIESGRLTMGSQVAAFEAAFAAHVGSRHAVMVNSGSSANLLAVAAMYHAKSGGSWQPGAEAIVPALAWSTTYAPLYQYGLKLRVVDVDADTLNVHWLQGLERIDRSTAMIVGVSLLGNPAAPRTRHDIRDRGEGVLFFEDNCESLGAKFGGKFCGTFGHCGTFSFFFSHHLNTVEGGMLVTDDDALADFARCLRAHGWTRDLPAHSALQGEGAAFSRAYDFVVPGYNLRPSEIAAAVGLVQLARLEETEHWRRRNAEQFEQIIEATSYRTQAWSPEAVPFAFPIICDTPVQRAQLIERLTAHGIECRLVAGGCFTRQRAARWYDYTTVGDLANACHVHDCGLMIGNHGRDMSALMPLLAQALS